MTTENTGLQLLYANTEQEVLDIINADVAMGDSNNWHALDNRDTNFNTVTNQSSNGGKAATELITNMVDAVLTKRCLEEQIDPKSSHAPRTMYAAVDKFVQQLNGGKISNADRAWLKKYSSENLVIGVTGSKSGDVCPCYMFCDNGEGQSPENFQNTFLSLSAKNKSEIPFVQGKYNMGSSGVLNYCGKHWFKLIMSRRYDGESQWGWTIIRKNKTAGMPYAEYFAPTENKVIQTIGSESINPFKIHNGALFKDFSLTTGTVVKLYEYYTGRAHSGFRATREVFNENMVETILPFRILDFRQTPSDKRSGLRALGIDERPFCGLEFLAVRTHKETSDDDPELESSVNKPMHVGDKKDPELGKIMVTAIPLKKDAAKVAWFASSKSRIFHHVNGQVQFKEMRGMLTNCGLPALKDRVIIFVDASKLNDATHHSVWKGDRQTINQTAIGDKYLAAIKDIIKNSSELKELNHKISQEILETATQDGSRDLVKDLVAQDKNFALLLDGKMPGALVDISGIPAEQAIRDDLKHDPTYIKLRERKTEFELPINYSRPIPCITDAQDDFFTRPDNRGYLLFRNDEVVNKFATNYHLKNGKLILSIKPELTAVQVGDVFKFKIGMLADSMPQAVYTEEEITLTIAPEKKTVRRDPKPRPKPKAQQAGLPPYTLLTKDGRNLHNDAETKTWEILEGVADFGAQDGGYIAELGESGKMYYINIDNVSFHNHWTAQKSADRAKSLQKYIMSMRILLLGLESALSSKQDSENDADDFRRMAAKGAASVAMTVCDALPKMFELTDNDESE